MDYPAAVGTVAVGEWRRKPKPLFPEKEYTEIVDIVRRGVTFMLSRHRGNEAVAKTAEIMKCIHRMLGLRHPPNPIDLAILAFTLRLMYGDCFEVNGSTWHLAKIERRSHGYYYYFRRL
ncbi:MAG: hypothetical protein QXH81_08110 [Thermofilaceae archaeon]